MKQRTPYYTSLKNRHSRKDLDENEEEQAREERLFKQQIDMLYPKPNSLEEILSGKNRPFVLKDIIDGINKDMQGISTSLYKDRLFNRVFTKENEFWKLVYQ